MPVSDDRDKNTGQFLKGSNPNPTGRPTGSRQKLASALFDDFYANWLIHGPRVIEAVRVEKPVDYLKIAASLMPKEFVVTDATLESITDDEIVDLFVAIRAAQAESRGDKAGARAKKAAQQTKAGPEGRLN